MRKNSVRKFIHAILDLLPLFVIPIFAININQKNVDPIQVEIQENKKVNFSQLERNGNFTSYDNWNGVRLDLNISNNIATLTPNQTLSNNNFAQNPVNDLAVGHKFLAYASYNTFATNQMVFQVYSNTTTQSFLSNIANNWDYAYIFFDVTANTTYNIRLYNQSTTTTNIAYFKNSMIVDLTQLYGAGNEITNFSDYISVFHDDYYEYTTNKIMLVPNVTTIYNDTDIGSQFLYSLYIPVHDYFNFNNLFNMGAIYDWIQLNLFSGTAPLPVFIIWNIIVYEFFVDLIFLFYSVFMFIIDFAEKCLERPFGR